MGLAERLEDQKTGAERGRGYGRRDTTPPPPPTPTPMQAPTRRHPLSPPLPVPPSPSPHVEREPLRLGRNWCMAIAIFGLWLACIEAAVYFACRRFAPPVAQQRYMVPGMAGLALLGSVTFGVWLVAKVRKERAKRAKAKAAAQQQQQQQHAEQQEIDQLTAPLLADAEHAA